MPELFRYLNYRIFLQDFYREKKSILKNFSYQVWATKAGFKSKSFIADVIDGKKNLSEESIFTLGKALDLNEQEFLFFKNLVLFNQAKTHRQKDHFFKLLTESNQVTEVKKVINNQYEFYSNWYHSTIRELVTLIDFGDDYALLARQITPQISPRQAKQSVELLLKLGMLVKKNNRYEQVDKDITTGDSVSSLAVEKFHLQNLELAAESIDSCNGEDREVSCVVCSMSKQKFKKVQKEIYAFRNKLISIINSTDQEETGCKKRVYHINMQLYPTTQEPMEAGHGN